MRRRRPREVDVAQGLERNEVGNGGVALGQADEQDSFQRDRCGDQQIEGVARFEVGQRRIRGDVSRSRMSQFRVLQSRDGEVGAQQQAGGEAEGEKQQDMKAGSVHLFRMVSASGRINNFLSYTHGGYAVKSGAANYGPSHAVIAA